MARLDRRSIALVAFVTVAVSALGGARAFADQPVVFDRAGNAPQISLIGDSTLAGVRWYADYGPLERYNFVFSGESCRRTVEQSCFSREGYRSANVISAMQAFDGQLGEVTVIMSGYNDPIWTIDEAIAGVVDEARSQGVDHVVWLSLRVSPDVDYSDPQEQSNVATFREYNEQLVEAAAASDGFLQVADWATYSLGAGDWFERDGVHLTPAGVDATTAFIANIVGRVLAGEDVSPAEAPWTVLVPGAEGDTVAAVQQAVIDAGVDLAGGADGVYGNDTMAAVAEYQRRVGDLQVTGAVDLSTARALGVFDDDAEGGGEDPSVGDDAAAPVPESTVPVLEPVDDLAERPSAPGSEPDTTSRWWTVAALIVSLGGLVALRRRQVVTRRRARQRQRASGVETGRDELIDARTS
ncbi:MAG: peptidoglycan-binding protein [Ilumatobacter sp.]